MALDLSSSFRSHEAQSAQKLAADGCLLSHRTVQPEVVSLGAGGHLRLQYLHAVRFQELVNRVVGILEIHQLPRTGRANLATRGGQALGDPVIAKRALVRDSFFRVNIAAAVRAGLHAIRAAQAVLLIHQHHTVRSHKGRTHRADLRAG